MRRSRHEDEQRPGLALLRPPAVRAYAEDVRTRVLEALEDVDLDAPNALLHEGSSSDSSSRTSSSARRRCSRRSSCGPEPSTRCPARPLLTVHPAALPRFVFPRIVRSPAQSQSRGPATASSARTRSRCDRSGSIARRSRTASSRSSSRTRGTARGDRGARRGGSGASARCQHAALLGRKRRRLAARALRPAQGSAPRRTGAARLVVRG